MLLISETPNAVVPKVGPAVVARRAQAIATLAVDQVERGAQMLDMKAGGLDKRCSAYLQAHGVGNLDGK